MNTADALGDLEFTVRAKEIPVECATPKQAKAAPWDCENPEQDANDLVSFPHTFYFTPWPENPVCTPVLPLSPLISPPPHHNFGLYGTASTHRCDAR
jgi:hypothetical protein